MENRTLKIFMSCALGAGIGALIALQLNHYFWWIGILIGGFIGYISYEFNRVIAAIPLAWRYATKNISIWKPYRYRPNIQAWKDNILAITYSLLLLISWGTVLVISVVNNDGVLFKLIGTIGVIACFISFLNLVLVFGDVLFNAKAEENRCLHKEVFIHWNSFSVLCFYFPKWMWFIGKTLIASIPHFLFTTGCFSKHLFLLIHSDIRLLCGIDAAIGACVGYFAGSAIVGAVAGGVFGVINYELISKRALGIIPTRRE